MDLLPCLWDSSEKTPHFSYLHLLLFARLNWSAVELDVCATPAPGPSARPIPPTRCLSLGVRCANSAPLAPPPSGPQWFRSSGIPRDVTAGWRYASLNRSYCNLFSVQRGFFSGTASHFLHLFGELRTPRAAMQRTVHAPLQVGRAHQERSFLTFASLLSSCNSSFRCPPQQCRSMTLLFFFFFNFKCLLFLNASVCRGSLAGRCVVISLPCLSTVRWSWTRSQVPPLLRPSVKSAGIQLEPDTSGLCRGLHKFFLFACLSFSFCFVSFDPIALKHQSWIRAPLPRLSHLGITQSRRFVPDAPLRSARCGSPVIVWENTVLPPCRSKKQNREKTRNQKKREKNEWCSCSHDISPFSWAAPGLTLRHSAGPVDIRLAAEMLRVTLCWRGAPVKRETF